MRSHTNAEGLILPIVVSEHYVQEVCSEAPFKKVLDQSHHHSQNIVHSVGPQLFLIEKIKIKDLRYIWIKSLT